MSAEKKSSALPPLDLSRWRKVPNLLICGGLVLALIGLVVSGMSNEQPFRQFGYSWLLAFMFFLSICLGGLFLVIVHHLFDAGWSVPIRRFCEHLANLLFPWMFIFWIPIGLLAFRLYPWMTSDPHKDHALHAKYPLFTSAGFYVVAAICFFVWWWLPSRLRYWSLKQDTTGDVLCTRKMRLHAGYGAFLFAVTLSFGAIMWMKALMHDWFSTMYGVYYFAGSVWLTLGVVYIITMILDRQRVLTDVLHEHQYYFIGSIFFAFTVFYAYIAFSQYFIIWNANMPEETFWYVVREKGTWFWVSMVIIFGHFFLPFLTLLRIDMKQTFAIMVPLGLWAALMHYVDLAFNIKPLASPGGFPWLWAPVDLGCLALMGGVLAKAFLKAFNSHPPFPQKDPRLGEAMGFYHPVPTQISGGELDEADENLPAAATTFETPAKMEVPRDWLA